MILALKIAGGIILAIAALALLRFLFVVIIVLGHLAEVEKKRLERERKWKGGRP